MQKAPIGDILIWLFLTIYCWGTLGYAFYKEGFSRGLNLIKTFGLEGTLIFAGLPIIFGIGVYRMNKEYFRKEIGRSMKKERY